MTDQHSSRALILRLQTAAFSIGLGLLIIGVCWGALSYQLLDKTIRISRTTLLIFATIALFLGYCLQPQKSKWPKPDPLYFAFLLPLLVVSSYLKNSQAFFQHQAALLILAALTLLSFLFFSRLFTLTNSYFLGLLLIISLVAGFGGLIIESSGRLLFNDDHPAFLYRLAQLKTHFPQIPFYNPNWNGGVEAREFFPSGSLNVFFLFLPLIYLFDPVYLYNWIVGGLLFILLPASAILAAKIVGLDRSGRYASALLSLAPSWLWYRWGLSYGTLGFITATILVPLNLALIARMIESPREFTNRLIILFFLSFSLSLLWPLGGIIMLPAILLIAANLGKIWANRRLMFCFLILIITHLPWMTIFINASQVGQFITQERPSGLYTPPTSSSVVNLDRAGLQTVLEPQRIFKELRKNIEPLNPILLLLALPGLFLISFKRHRLLVAASTLWLLCLALLAAPFKPQLELDRLFLVLWLILTIPAAQAISALRTAAFSSGPKMVARLGFSLAAAILLFTPLLLYRITRNQTAVRYHFADDSVWELADAITQYGGQGRVLFAGFVLHELSHGHIAPLPLFTDKPLVASNYQHTHWQYRDVIPDYYRAKRAKGVEQFLDLYNVSAIVTHEPFWRKWYGKQADKYELVWRYANFSLFQRKDSENSYFLSGQGAIVGQDSSSVTIVPQSSEAVIKFNYLPFLKAPGCELEEYPLPGGINFIRLKDCTTGEQIVLRAIRPWHRFFAGKG